MINTESHVRVQWGYTPHSFSFSRDASNAAQKATASARAKEASATEDTRAGLEQVIVLIAEDEETIAETLAMIVEDAGYAPLVAHNGREALVLARERHPKLILTDLMMPYLSGADLIAAVRRHAASEGYISPPIVLVTAAGRMRAEQAGADVIIAKPFDVAKIEAVLQRLIGERSE